MKRILVLFLLSLFLASISMAEQVTVSFQPKNDSDKIDSVHVTNLTRGQMVKLVPGESVVFNLVTSAEHPLINDAENGYLYPNPSSRFTTLTFNNGKSEEENVFMHPLEWIQFINWAKEPLPVPFNLEMIPF